MMYLLWMCVFLNVAVFADSAAESVEEHVVLPPTAQTVMQSPGPIAAPTLDVAKISKALGHLIANNIESFGFQFDMKQFIKGLEDATAGVESPMTEDECFQAIMSAQDVAFKKLAVENLKTANDFMNKNAKEKGVVVVEEGKVHYKIEHTGNGDALEPHYTSLVHYTGKYLDGTSFGGSKEDELLALDEVIPGLSKGLLGMKEGEKRIVYIHPDLAYGTTGYLPPNSLLTFEVELLKANVPQAEPSNSITTHPAQGKAEHLSEIVAPSLETPSAVR